MNAHAAVAEAPDAQRGVVAGAHQFAAVGREGDAVDVLAVAFQHARRAAIERPQADAVVPRCRGEHRAVRRQRQRGDRAAVAVEHSVGLRLALRPDRDMGVGAGGGDAAVLEPGHRVHRAVVKAHHLLGDVARSSDQRIAEVSKLPEMAWLPSGEIASARTGPPWPRNCAFAGVNASGNSRTTQKPLNQTFITKGSCRAP